MSRISKFNEIKKNMKRLTEINLYRADKLEYKYRQKMCPDCKFYVDSRCIKGRSAKSCAEKYLKNKE